MGTGIFFPLCALPFSVIIVLLYFIKGHIRSKETLIFGTLIVSNMIGLVIELLCTYASHIYYINQPLSVFILKSYLFYLIFWISTITYYVYSVQKKENDIKKKRINIFSIYYLFVGIILAVLPIKAVISQDFSQRYTSGLAVTFTYVISAIAICMMIIMLLTNLKRLKEKKFIPIIFFLIFGGLVSLVQMINPSILLMTYLETLICVIMYFTIENPDIKMLSEVTAAKDAADKANRAKSDFLSSMSHEIRTPLNAIVGFSECIKNADSLEEAKENAADIVTASESLLEIVNGILDISKIESGKLELVQSDYDIYKILDEVVKLIKARLGDKPLNFEVNIAEDIPHVLYGDHFNIKKILINFLTNAVKYTDEGYVKFDVKCVIVNNNVCRLIMSVKDSGRGIKKENIDKLFTKFQRLDEDKNTTIEGTGLGLAITKQLVEMMHGKIVVNSIYGEGSEFTVAIDQRISNHKLETQEDVSDDVIDLTGRKILVVDDNKLNLKVAVKLLQPYKCVVETCESGFGCIDKITSGNKYDIILLDDMMPKMRGSETLTRLKADPKFNIPVVALTANAIQGMREQYML